jgi:hypothetical protein
MRQTLSMLTGQEILEIAARVEAATPGPWRAFIEGRDHYGGDDFIRTGGFDDGAPDMYVSLSYATSELPVPARSNDLDFIAAARQDIPRLLAEIERLRAGE